MIKIRLTGSALLVVLLAGSLPILASDEPARYRGQQLSEVLGEIAAGGVPLLFTSEVVRPEMRVLREPRARRAPALVEELLAQHGLELERGPGGVLIVVPGTAAELGEERRATAILAGRALIRGGGQPLGGALVRVSLERPPAEPSTVLTRGDGTFLLSDLAPGVYTVEIAAQGFLEQRIDGLTLAAGDRRTILFELPPQPFLEDEVVVRPSRLSLLSQRPEGTLDLGREEIDSLPHLGDDVFRAISLLPGATAGDVTAQFSVHGGRRDEVQVVLDGQEIYDAFHLKEYDNALSVVSARSLAAASLTTGAYGVGYGDRMSGVLDLRTADPAPGQRRQLIGLSVLEATLATSGSFADDRASWLLTGRHGSNALAAEFLGDEQPSFWDLLGKARFDGRLGSFSLHLLTAGDQLEVSKRDEEDFEQLETNYRTTYAWLNHTATLTDRLLVETLGSWASIRRNRGGLGTEEDGGFELHDRRDLEVLTLRQSWSLELASGHQPGWGFELRSYDAVYDYALRLDPGLEIAAPFAPPRQTEQAFDATRRGDHFGLWVSDRWAGDLGPSGDDRLTAEVGLRYDRHSATGDTLFSPRVNLAWRLGEKSVVRAAWGRFYQSQRPYELLVEEERPRLYPAELSQHWVLGAETAPAPNRLGIEALRLELYRREIDHPRPRFESLLEPVNFFPEIEPDRVQIVPESGRAEGLELMVRGRLGSRTGWWLAYSYAEATERLDFGAVGRRVPRALDQRHTLVLAASHRLPRDWLLNIAWRYHTGWPTTPVTARLVPAEPDDDPGGEEPGEEPEEEPEEELEAVFGPLNGDRLPAYHRLDLRASRGWALPRGRLTFFVEIQNLYNRRNLAGFDVELDDEAGAVIKIPEDWPGIFPSFGLTWEF